MVRVGNYEPGSDLMLINTIYHRMDKKNGIDYDQLDIIYRDNKTGKKHIEEIKNPDYRFYMCKEGIYPEYNMLSIERDKVDEYIVPYKNLTYELCKICDEMKFYNECMRTANYKALKNINADKRLFGTDRDIHDHYRIRFQETYPSSNTTADRAYFDIETDAIKYVGDIDREGNSPVSVITLVSDSTKNVFTLILRNPNHPVDTVYPDKDYSNVPLRKLPGQMLNEIYSKNCREFENKMASLGNDGISDYIKDFIIKQGVKGQKFYKKFGLTDFKYNLLFYDNEIDLLKDFFYIANTISPDVLMAWNIAFDIQFIIERLKKKGLDPAVIICDPEFSKKVCWYFEDTLHSDFHKRGDYATISTKMVWIDQMIQFASKRAGQAQLDSYKLDVIANITCDIHKLDYSHITHDLLELPYKDFEVYILYNIMDTVAQICVENKTGDIETLFAKSYMNATRLEKSYRQTVYSQNRGEMEFSKNNNQVLGNNINHLMKKDDDGYPGALVANPKLLKPCGMKILGQPTTVYNNSDDFDIKSEYPNALRENNMSPMTMISRLIIDDDHIFVGQNRFGSHDYNNGGYFIDDMRSGNWLEFAHRWLHFPSYKELLGDIKEYFLLKYNIDLNFIRRNSKNLPISRYKTPILRVINKPIQRFLRRNDQ
jgi:hypothetical protein